MHRKMLDPPLDIIFSHQSLAPTASGSIYPSIIQKNTKKHFGPQWSLFPCNRRFWGINEGLMGALGECSWQVTPQKCLTRRVLSRCPITFEQNRSKKHEQFSTALPAVFGRFWPKNLKNQIAKKSSQHHGAPKPLPKHLQCTPLTKPSTTNQV